MDEFSKILLDIKERYCNLKENHRKHYSCHLKNVERFELLESKGDYDVGLDGSGSGNQVLITYNSLFGGEYTTLSAKTITLVQGQAGIGKTTLCLSILEDWSTGNLFQEFHIVLYLPLRNVATACSLPELLSTLYPDFNPDKCAKMATCLEKNEKCNILIIADGWEDLQPSQCQTESFLHSLLFSSDIIPNSFVTVLITTAKLSCIQTHTLERINRFITLPGFDSIVMESIIQSELEGDTRAIRYLTAQLNDNQLISSICGTPFHLATLCDLCRSSGDHPARPLPNTVTELYAKLVWTHAAMNIRSNDTYKSILSLSKYDDLPEGLRRPWQLLCELAFKNYEKGHGVFSLSDVLTPTLSELKSISFFGLIKPIPENENNLIISFLHPCFEEYLASLYLAKQPQEAQLSLIQDISRSTVLDNNAAISFWHFFVSNYAHMVASVNPDILVQVLKIVSTVIANCSNKGSDVVSLCHLSFEAKKFSCEQPNN